MRKWSRDAERLMQLMEAELRRVRSEIARLEVERVILTNILEARPESTK